MASYKAEDNLGVRHRRLNANTSVYKQSHVPTDPQDFENELKRLTVPENTRRRKEIITQLRDPNSCQLFYQHYVRDNPHYAIKFLPHCSTDFIKEKILDVSKILSPQWLKILCEKCPEVAKLFYDSFENDQAVLKKYLEKEKEYYDKLRFLLKVNGDIFLDITEKYFDVHAFKKFSTDATKYFMQNYRERFDKKPELYAARVLDIKTVAKTLNKDEIKDLVIKLARAKYLTINFTYKFVEDLIKALPCEERAIFKKQVFVDKCYGDSVEKWPYTAPARPHLKNAGINIFQDEHLEPRVYESPSECIEFRSLIQKRKCYLTSACKMAKCSGIVIQSPLDKLFNQNRFFSFDKVFQEFKKKMGKESLEGRQNMILVLISKSGGKEGSVNELLKYVCERHINEPDHFRATVIRSLVKRCSIWRLSSETWTLFLRFALNLGLDGSDSNVPCNEGIHASVLRLLLTSENLEVPSLLWESYLKNFSSLKEYSLTAYEKRIVINKLPKFLLDYARESTQNVSVLEMFLDTLNDYDVNANKLGFNESIAEIVRRDSDNESLLKSLFRKKIARKELFKEYFSHIQTQDSYLNALKHDPSILESGKYFEKLVESDKLNHNRFFCKLAKYYNEPNGLAEKYLKILVENAEKSPRKELARPIAILAGDNIFMLIDKFDSFSQDTNEKRFASALKANMHLTQTNTDIKNMDWKIIGAKAVANQIMNCSLENVPVYLDKLLSWRTTNRMAFALSVRIGKEYNIFSAVAEKCPILALKTALWYARRENKLDVKVWDIIIPLINKLVSEKCNNRLLQLLFTIEHIPEIKKPEYYATAFKAINKISKAKSAPILCNIHNILFDVNSDFVKDVITEFLLNDFNIKNIKTLVDREPANYSYVLSLSLRYELYFRIIAKYLLLCKDESTQHERLKIVDLLFNKIESAWNFKENNKYLIEVLSNVLKSFKYQKVYLDTQFVSPLPVFEYFVNKMKNVISKEKYFRLYSLVHITMLYFKAVRQSIKNNAEVYGSLPKEIDNAAKIVGHIFGAYIGNEIVQLQLIYSSVVIKVYHEGLAEYITTFPYHSSRDIFITATIKGLLEIEQAHLLSAFMYHSQYRSIEKHEKQELENTFKNIKNEEAKFIFYNFSDEISLTLSQ